MYSRLSSLLLLAKPGSDSSVRFHIERNEIMRPVFRTVVLAASLLALAAASLAQRPRTAADATAPQPARTVATPSPAPQSVNAKYEGGVFGYNKVQEGTLVLDDVNSRLLFRNKQGKEVFFIPYSAITQEYADSHKTRPKSATIAGSLPVPYGINPIGLIKTRNQYVTLQFYDESSHASGITSFRVDSKEICASVVQALAEKAGLVQRGEIFIRQRPADSGPLAQSRSLSKPAVAVENEALSARIISLPRPVYPEEARQAKVTGSVRVLVTVDEQGNVAEAEAISGSPMLQAAAVEAAKQAKFEPLLNEGRRVRTKSVISYNFTGD
jgi:TonB family protein